MREQKEVIGRLLFRITGAEGDDGAINQIVMSIRGRGDAKLWGREARLEVGVVECPSVADPVTR